VTWRVREKGTAMRQGTPFASLTDDERVAVLFERQLELNARIESCLASSEAVRERALRVTERARRGVELARRAVDRDHERALDRARS
jgi:hypothetical protein